jgi:hypothetical protein
MKLAYYRVWWLDITWVALYFQVLDSD